MKKIFYVLLAALFVPLFALSIKSYDVKAEEIIRFLEDTRVDDYYEDYHGHERQIYVYNSPQINVPAMEGKAAVTIWLGKSKEHDEGHFTYLRGIKKSDGADVIIALAQDISGASFRWGVADKNGNPVTTQFVEGQGMQWMHPIYVDLSPYSKIYTQRKGTKYICPLGTSEDKNSCGCYITYTPRTLTAPTISLSSTSTSATYEYNKALSLKCPSPTTGGVPNPSVSYKWTGPSGVSITNATSQTCTIPATKIMNNNKGTYTCTVTASNSEGSKTATYKVTVTPANTGWDPSVSLTLNGTSATSPSYKSGDTLSLKATASGNVDGITYSWKKGSSAVSDTSATLSLGKQTNQSLNGVKYTVTITNSSGKSASANITLKAENSSFTPKINGNLTSVDITMYTKTPAEISTGARLRRITV